MHVCAQQKQESDNALSASGGTSLPHTHNWERAANDSVRLQESVLYWSVCHTKCGFGTYVFSSLRSQNTRDSLWRSPPALSIPTMAALDECHAKHCSALAKMVQTPEGSSVLRDLCFRVPDMRKMLLPLLVVSSVCCVVTCDHSRFFFQVHCSEATTLVAARSVMSTLFTAGAYRSRDVLLTTNPSRKRETHIRTCRISHRQLRGRVGASRLAAGVCARAQNRRVACARQCH
jgi:hypothetical protein